MSFRTPFAFVGSIGTSRSSTSLDLTGSRAGIVAMATTSWTFDVPVSVAFCWAWLIV